MIGWLLNLCYGLGLSAALPVLAWRAATQGKYRTGWAEKLLGWLPVSAEGERVVWLHAVSVGEVLQLRSLISALNAQRPDLSVLITTTTVTGQSVARETFPQCRVAYCPLDFTWAVETALRRVRPVMLGLVELELWPNLIRHTAAHRVPLILVNGRLSENSYRGYRRIRPAVRHLLMQFNSLTAQTAEYAQRLADLGAPAERLHVTGSLKFDGVDVGRLSARTDELRAALGLSATDQVFMAGSTHAPEEALILDVWEQLRADVPGLRLLIVPRHRERFDEVAALITARGWAVRRRSAERVGEATGADTVCLLDTLGELTACWGIADIAYVGGSLTARGGQNMIEPAAFGVPVLVGPNTTNFRDVVEGLCSVGGIQVASDPSDLLDHLRRLLANPSEASTMGQAAQTFVRAQQGATVRMLELMAAQFPATDGVPLQRAA